MAFGILGAGGQFGFAGTRAPILRKEEGPEREWLQALAWWLG